MIGDSETMKHVASGKEVDRETEKFMNGLEAPRQTNSEMDMDANTQDLVEDLLKTLEEK
jgi:hypothetical protein